MAKHRVYMFINLDIKKYDSDICSKHRRRVSKTLPSNKNLRKTRN